MRVDAVFALAAFGGPIAAVVLAVTPSAQQAFRASVNLVTVTATVRDSQGRYVDRLEPENFVLHEDGVRQPIAHFSHSPDAAVSVGILLDVRGSMASKMKTAVYAIERFVRRLRPEDELFLATFADTVRLRQEFTTNHAAVLGRVRALDLAREQVGVSEGIDVALRELGKARVDKRGVLVVTDRQDETHYTNADGFKLRFYVFGKDFVRDPAAAGDLPALHSELYVPGRSRDLDTFLDQVSNELRNQYTLAYYTNAPPDGHLRTIRVATSPAFTVVARTGYSGK